MTDWLPWGFTVMKGMFSTTALALRSLGRTPVRSVPDLQVPKIALVVTAVVSFAVFALYLVFGESWIWYQ